MDELWASYRKSARNAGLLVGGYWRFFTHVDLAAQVRRFAAGLRAGPVDLAPLVDIEDAGALTPPRLTDWAVRVLEAVHAAAGRRPILYTGAWFLRDKLEEYRLDRWERCIANWSATSWPDHTAIFWQHEGDTRVPWAAGPVDLQRFAARPADLKAHTYENELLYYIDADGQLFGPRAKWYPLPEGRDERLRTYPTRVVSHTMVGFLGAPPPSPSGTDAYFRRSGVGVESTVGVGGRYDGAKRDGEIRQWVECDIVANANLEGDQDPPNCVSVETSDGGTHYNERWGPKQAESVYQFNAAVCWRYGIPAAALPDSREDRTGIGWHRLGIDGDWPNGYPLSGRVAGTERWSASRGKVCPGDVRIKQLYYEGIPRVKAVLGSVLDPQEGDMTEEQVREAVRAVLGLKSGQNLKIAVYGQQDNALVFDRTVNTENPSSIVARLEALATQVAALASAVAKLSITGATVDIDALATAVADEQARRHAA
jgi:Glycosyl hydrolases family 25